MWITLKRLLLWFWALWLALVVATNVCDALKVLDLLPADFRFASGNFQAILDVLAPFVSSRVVPGALFAGVILWEALSMTLFAWAALTFRGYQDRHRRTLLVATFAVSLSLWGTFQIACEAFPSPLAYKLSGTHRLLFVECLATLLAMVLLPDE